MVWRGPGSPKTHFDIWGVVKEKKQGVVKLFFSLSPRGDHCTIADIVMTEEKAAPAMKWKTEPANIKKVTYAAINGGGVAACHFDKASTTGWRETLKIASHNMLMVSFRGISEISFVNQKGRVRLWISSRQCWPAIKLVRLCGPQQYW